MPEIHGHGERLKCDFRKGYHIHDLPELREDQCVIQCWTLSWKDRFKLLFSGKVYVVVHAAKNPPMSVETEDSKRLTTELSRLTSGPLSRY
jgi:hypothetical protein